ncbi:MAG: HlyD family secretion protein [Gemmataceae bacterium]
MRSVMRPTSLVWLAGILLLVGTAAGASWILNQSEANTAKADENGPKAPFEGKGIICVAYVDVEEGIASLYPEQPGRVVEIYAKDGQSVEKNEVLLKVDDTLQMTIVEEAEGDLKIAEQKLKALVNERDRKIRVYESMLKLKQIAVAAAQKDEAIAQTLLKQAQAKKKQAEATAAYQQNLLKANSLDSSHLLRKAKAAIEEAEGAIEQASRAIQKAKSGVEAARQEVVVAQQSHPKEKFEDQINIAKEVIVVKLKQLEKAKHQLSQCLVKAPSRGTVLRVYARKGETLGNNPKLPALQFCPKGARIVRAEVQQEWAHTVKVDQECIIEDDSSSKVQWSGKIVRLSDWFTHRRSIVLEPFQFNDVRTLEAIIEITGPEGQPLRIGQRMRVMIKQGGP